MTPEIEPDTIVDGRYKVLSRDIAYHGTTMGALSITGLPSIKEPFEPLVPGSVRVTNTQLQTGVANPIRSGGRHAGFVTSCGASIAPWLTPWSPCRLSNRARPSKSCATALWVVSLSKISVIMKTT